MDPSLATVLVAAIAALTTSIIAPIVTFVIKYLQDKQIAEKLNMKVDGVAHQAATAALKTGDKLDEIHNMVNGRLSEALERIAVLEKLLRAERADHSS